MKILRAIALGGLIAALAACTPSQPGAGFLPANPTQSVRQAHQLDNGAGGPVAHPAVDNGAGGPIA